MVGAAAPDLRLFRMSWAISVGAIHELPLQKNRGTAIVAVSGHGRDARAARRMIFDWRLDGTSELVPNPPPHAIMWGFSPEFRMAKPTRPLRPPPARLRGTRTFFVTSAAWGRRSLFRSERMALLFIGVLGSYRARNSYILHEFVLMPDHFHALISVPPGTSVEKAVQLIKGGFSFRAGREIGFRSEIWGRGFTDEYITSAEEFESKVRYIRRNPVRAGLARTPEDYPYGAAGSGFAMDPMPEHLRG